MNDMDLVATPVVKNKFWIVRKNGRQVATIQTTPTGVAFVKDQQREKFVSINLLKSKYNIEFANADTKKKTPISFEVNSFPCIVRPYNALIDAQRGLPIYTDKKRSKSYYCAGHYMLKFNEEYVHAFCPKLISINRHDYLGPFHFKDDAILAAKKIK